MIHETPRPAVPSDVPAVKAVTDAAFHHYIDRIGLVPAPMEYDHAANVAAGRVFVVGDPVTGLVVVIPEADHLYLDEIAVHPDAQGTGLGRVLMEWVEARARQLGLPEVRLLTNAMMWENQKLYERYGYEVVERRADGPYDRIHYRKVLNSPPMG
ncbi:Acetyltransferase [Streptomyces venezuelae]|uniref:GNAT family N-acetyltransferase n=1 Tax=Streptomyces gardneri TaxID=66892 RepID=UPI0006E455D2|nr:GNAT family N-acetyltransferase [Streptomyces gardneri]ALO07336.1 Acetyltransferase [Streptomyces venezuelae]QPK44671.1 GNAT family N-acetyltransferase [Streptomyces gardneri]WRK35978.1 GNAT family N-acetyltransferase [Streptomyces venezuelae]